jgi:hypothetical protein
MGFVVEAYYDGREPVTRQGTNPFAGQELDPITLGCLADWFIRVGRRMGHISPADQLRRSYPLPRLIRKGGVLPDREDPDPASRS